MTRKQVDAVIAKIQKVDFKNLQYYRDNIATANVPNKAKDRIIIAIDERLKRKSIHDKKYEDALITHSETNADSI